MAAQLRGGPPNEFTDLARPRLSRTTARGHQQCLSSDWPALLEDPSLSTVHVLRPGGPPVVGRGHVNVAASLVQTVRWSRQATFWPLSVQLCSAEKAAQKCGPSSSPVTFCVVLAWLDSATAWLADRAAESVGWPPAGRRRACA